MPYPLVNPQAQPGEAGYNSYLQEQAAGILKVHPKSEHYKPLPPLFYSQLNLQDRVQRFGADASSLLEQAFGGAFRSQLETLSSGFGQSQRQAQDLLTANGVPGSFYAANIAPQQQLGLSSSLAGLRGEAQSGEAQAQLELRANLLSAMNQISTYYDALRVQVATGGKAGKTGSGAQDLAAAGAGVGSLLSGIGDLYSAAKTS